MALTKEQATILEKTMPVYTVTLLDETDAAVPLTSISAITLTLYDRHTGGTINSRSAQNIKNANNVTIHATSGLLTWSMQEADNAIQDSTLPAEIEEEHIALFQWTLSDGKKGKYERRFYIRQLEKVT